MQSILGAPWGFGGNNVTSPASFKQTASFPAGSTTNVELQDLCHCPSALLFYTRTSNSNISFMRRTTGQRDRRHSLDSCYSRSRKKRGSFFYTHWKLSRIPPSVLGNANHNNKHMRILSLFWNLLKKTFKSSLDVKWVWITTVTCFCCSRRCCWFLSPRCRSWDSLTAPETSPVIPI